MRIAIVGAGAAGCFAAVNIKRLAAGVDVTVFESGRRPLAKVAVTGGGRCNLTNSFENVRSMAEVYPRGGRLMQRLFHVFSHEDAMRWFENAGVRLVTQDDCCVFPRSQDAMEIVGTLTAMMRRGGVRLLTGCRVRRIERCEDASCRTGYRLFFGDDGIESHFADIVIVTTGGSPKASGLDMLSPLGLKTEPPVPSLFSLCLPSSDITSLMGTVVDDVTVSLAGTKLRASGPLLITHWGMSGPAILKLSSHAARVLHDCGYRTCLSVNWMGDMNEAETIEMLYGMAGKNPQKQLANVYPDRFNARLWRHLLLRAGLNPAQRWGEPGRKSYNRLADTLINSLYDTDGKNKFKEEFVTCGGVSLGNVSPVTLECKTCPGLYFAGEVLDIDAVTGGFNLQAAWTTGFVVAQSVVMGKMGSNDGRNGKYDGRNGK